ncbi:Peptidase M19 renal dipeptidase [Penicillium odoratum]|uniref:Peptidase M19 renal dipeptidase n=1 Tax=Penicillium odoratum TaxID=1167516 RepID=UPI00254861BC|nr:Peptidase M19 renal dipeptidase [Penicillium odoratum]KAJ5772557.1 Peptidase M19 renal dipeptidase [Penicillium odoratum]
MEKISMQKHYEALAQDPENLKIAKPKSCQKRRWALLLFSVIAGGWFLRPHCHHVHRIASIEERVQNILTQTPLIDGHDDFPIFIRSVFHNHIHSSNFTDAFLNGTLPAHVDLPRLKRGHVGGTFWSVFVPCPTNWTDFSDETYAPSIRETMEQVDLMSRIQQTFPGVFSTPPNGTTALSAFQEGKIISPLGIEGLHSIGNSLAHLRIFYELGVSYATLTHNCHNRYADAAVVELPGGGVKKSDPLWHGVSPEGQKVVFEMNRLGMIVDLAHVSVDTMRDVLGAGKTEWAGSRAPIIFSHSSAYALCPHPRNVPDDVLELVREKKSIVMVNFSPDFISCVASDRADGIPDNDPENATLERVADHIMHIGTVAGFDHVGLGSDFDGIPTVPRGLEDVSKFPDLIAELLRRGLSDEDAAKVAGGNLLRVWRDVDQVALKMQAEGASPVEDDSQTM